MEVLLVLIAIGAMAYYFYKGSLRHRPEAVRASDTDWVRPFVLYYLASEFAKEAPGKVPPSAQELVLGTLSRSTEQSLLVDLRDYLAFAFGRERSSDDLRQAILEARILLRAEMQTGNSRVALKRFIRRMHTENGVLTVSESEIDELVSDSVDQINRSDEVAGRMRALILRDGLEELFAAKHGKPINEYEHEMLQYREKAYA